MSTSVDATARTGIVRQLAWYFGGLIAAYVAAAVTEGDERIPAFAGSDKLMGEFGWLAAVTILVVGVVAALWHTRTMAGPLPLSEAR